MERRDRVLNFVELLMNHYKPDIICCDRPFPQVSKNNCITCLSCKLRVYEGLAWICPECKHEQDSVSILNGNILNENNVFIQCENSSCNIKMNKIFIIENDEQLAKYKKNNKRLIYCQNIEIPDTMLLDLKTQEQFETMWFHDLGLGKSVLDGMRADGAWIQYHTASWCKACSRLDLSSIVKAAEEKSLTVWKIDVDVNDYTSGYCGVRSMPTFQFCVPKKIVSTLQSSSTDTVLNWINTSCI